MRSRASSGETEQICRICSSEEHIRAKGFSSRCFLRAQSIHGLGTSGIRNKMKSPEAFDGDYLSASDCFGRRQKGIVFL